MARLLGAALRVLLAAVMLLLGLSSLAWGQPAGDCVEAAVVLSEPVAVPDETLGTGLCSVTAISDDPFGDFGILACDTYSSGVDSFLAGNVPAWTERVEATDSDFSNNNQVGTAASLGDFLDAAMQDCPSGGCSFAVSDLSAAFGVRLRGFLHVPAAWVDKEVHFGAYFDDAVSLAFYDPRGGRYPVMVRPPLLGRATWRFTKTVRFEQSGLYPIEIHYVEVAEHAALELSVLVGPFDDFERSASDPPVIELDAAGFTLLPPSAFVHTIRGLPSYPDLGRCQQCERSTINLPDEDDCGAGYYCNEAGLCAPCDSARVCGPSCSPCGGMSPFCINTGAAFTCVECRQDSDCPVDELCDLSQNACFQPPDYECERDLDCARGERCVEFACEACAAADACAGSSCNCCPVARADGPMQCAVLTPGEPPVCVQCTSNADCVRGVCDTRIGHCVDQLADNQRADCCGPGCQICPDDAPYCLPGPFGTACAACRWDLDCPTAQYCRSGQCWPCVEDGHCGPRCTRCRDDAPFCASGADPNQASCVGCIDDSDCPGSACDRAVGACTEPCSVSCPSDRPHCFGDACVGCYADGHCPCGGTCDLTTYTCRGDCLSSSDCLGTEHCAWPGEGGAASAGGDAHSLSADSRTCALGPLPDSLACGGPLAAACQVRVGTGHAPPWGPALMVGLLIGWRIWRRIGI